MVDATTLSLGDDCALDLLTQVTGNLFEECCGKCVFGYEGLFQIHTILTDISNKKGKLSDLDLIAELCTAMKNQSACEIGELASELINDAMNNYGDVIREHISKKTCRASVCRQFLTFHVLQDKCVGCEECREVCEDDAIEGKKKFVHIIDQDECTQCGKCIEACEYDAIVTAGAIKPRCPAKPLPCTAK